MPLTSKLKKSRIKLVKTIIKQQVWILLDIMRNEWKVIKTNFCKNFPKHANLGLSLPLNL